MVKVNKFYTPLSTKLSLQTLVPRLEVVSQEVHHFCLVFRHHAAFSVLSSVMHRGRQLWDTIGHLC